MPASRTDLMVVGGGIVGLATAFQFTRRYPGRKVRVIEKEKAVGLHQTGHNSGVLHSGIYYKPGSLKAVNCRSGKQAMEKFAREYGIPFENCGKVIVARSETERATMLRIYERGRQNGVECRIIDREELSAMEPHAAGTTAIHVPEAGIIDFGAVCRQLERLILQAGGDVCTGAEVRSISRSPGSVVAATTAGTFHAAYLVNCGGLYADTLAELAGDHPPARIVPFRGEYFELVPEAVHLCNNLIYPVPDPNFPFLGVHLTRMIGGGVECGPNAVLAFAREGYTRGSVNLRELGATLTYGGFIRLARNYWKTGIAEMWRSFSRKAFVRELQKLVPELEAHHLKVAPAGVRAQAVSSDGKMIDDFLIEVSGRMIHVCNAPSPAATASLNIGQIIVDRLADQIK